MYSSNSIEKLVDIFATLPTIGRKTAHRLTYHLLRQGDDFNEKFSKAIIELKKNVRLCSVCFNYTEIDPCPICSSHKRERNVICVVEEPNDVMAIEKTNEYRGLYHVLHGVINPLEGISQDEIKIKELLSRLNGIDEIILALNPSTEGELTSFYIAKMMKSFNIKTTKIASGVPMGSAIEYSDEATLTRALEGRIAI
ncbi:MAG TPA: recombination mediator RecR [Candidatus Kapabacteria bacterium]|nr:recombination mediator RecR [Candidatus Kapabacteria bacterium]